MKWALIVLGVLAGGCDASQTPATSHEGADLEAAVLDCERERRRDCDAACKALADRRREDRMAAYRQAF